MKDLDRFDRHLLDLLRVDSRRTGEQLSELVGLSPAACLRRVQKLRQIGAIEREVALIAPDYKKQGSTIIMLVRFGRQNPQIMDEFLYMSMPGSFPIRLFLLNAGTAFIPTVIYLTILATLIMSKAVRGIGNRVTKYLPHSATEVKD